MLTVVPDDGPGQPGVKDGSQSLMDEIVREGARRMLAEALQAEARQGQCWFHMTANVLAALPKSAHPGAKKALAEIWGAEDKDHAVAAVTAFDAVYRAKFPKAVAKITDDQDQLLAFYDYPAEHRVHLRTTNPVSAGATFINGKPIERPGESTQPAAQAAA